MLIAVAREQEQEEQRQQVRLVVQKVVQAALGRVSVSRVHCELIRHENKQLMN